MGRRGPTITCENYTIRPGASETIGAIEAAGLTTGRPHDLAQFVNPALNELWITADEFVLLEINDDYPICWAHPIAWHFYEVDD